MVNVAHSFLIFLFSIAVSGMAIAKPVVTKEDYQRAAKFQTNMHKMVHQVKLVPNWLPGNTGFWYLHESPTAKTFMKVEFSSLSQHPLFDHAKLAKTLSKKFKLNASKENLPFEDVSFLDQNNIEFKVDGDVFTFDLIKNKVRKNKAAEQDSLQGVSPDGKWLAFVRSYNMFVRSLETGVEIQLSNDGGKNYEYANEYMWDDTIEGENGLRPEQLTVKWSPDSKRILTSIWDFRNAEKMHLLDWSIDKRYRPKLLSYYRASPGDDTILKEIPVIFDVSTREKVIPKLPSLTHINAADLEWGKDSQYVYGSYFERGYKKLHGIVIYADDGRIDTLFTDESKTNIDSVYFNHENVLSDEGSSISKVLFTSSRSGWNQIYSVDAISKKVVSVTSGKFVVKEFVHYDEKQKLLYFVAAGKELCNPYYDYLYRVAVDGSDLSLLTPEKVNHEVHMSPDGEYFVDNYSTTEQATVSVLRKTEDGSVVLSLNNADASELYSMGWKPPQTFNTIAKDGKTEIYGAIWKPTNFDPEKKYPVLDASYTGPHTHVFPKDFEATIWNNNQSIAELGFLVVAIDGLGTIGRSKAFHDWSYRKLGYSLEDHVLAIKELGKRFDWVDATKVGIFGHSAGGYDSAQALLRFPDFYKVGVASSADHDHRMEKAWWPEMYMGWPVGSEYHDQSNITMAGNLKGKLLITHGGIDENVNPSATFKLAEALIKAGKEFDLLIFPSSRHYYRGKNREYFMKKRWNYFVEHLLGAEPIWSVDFPAKRK